MEFERAVDRIRATMREDNSVPWSWIATNLHQLLTEYPSGLTEAIIFSDLELKFMNPYTAKSFSIRHLGFCARASRGSPPPPLAARTESRRVCSRQNTCSSSYRRLAMRILCASALEIIGCQMRTRRKSEEVKISEFGLSNVIIDTDLSNGSQILHCWNRNNVKEERKVDGDGVVYIDITPQPVSLNQPDGSGRKRLNVYISDMTADADNAVFVLYDEQIMLACLFQKVG
ncbi:hypothetical protein BC936DRAFT_147903 [Jimgerdemannia flammicorona]|uniref:Uncharacterized protein n=2 Tax=Jimgerdemannia flammicorona TaxID=994334 RepID=A0A433QJC1_9FUNG|nr:hypothetical protein BC936DRAFT_147903 [Jimgerdemannia flammicorona]RUS29864.1 hypothetical protein BC938DRAFT_480136 [Jimgerdemannia flammicorona]